MATNKKSVLGRGLGALIDMDSIAIKGSFSINEIKLNKIVSNPSQPRKDFDEESLNALSQSITEVGVIQPITLREMENDTYQIIAGERRYRASLKAGLKSIPAYIRTANDENMLEMALIENVQREDLNAMEIALTYSNLIEQYKLTQEKLSNKVGKNRSTITNYLRLLKLPAEIQLGLKNKDIDMGHARALLAIEDPTDQLKVYSLILKNNLSVRAIEKIAKDISEGKSIEPLLQKSNRKKYVLPEEYVILGNNLSHFLGTKVKFNCSKNGNGHISIPFSSNEELERIFSLIGGTKQE